LDLGGDPEATNVDLTSHALRLRETVVRKHLAMEAAVESQFEFVECMRRTPIPGAGGNRPALTAWAEAVLATFYETEDAALVHGAGTGAIRAMLNAAVRPGSRVLVHDAPVYRTTEAAMRHMGLDLVAEDFNDISRCADAANGVDAVYIQHATQRLGDRYDPAALIAAVRSVSSSMPLLTDENCMVMRAPLIGVQFGATASAFSLLKLLAPSNIGCVLGPATVVGAIRRDLSSQGSQVRGEDARDALESMVYAPVAMAIQNQVVEETAERINELVLAGLRDVYTAVASQPAVRSIVLVLTGPFASDVLARLRAASPAGGWVAEESRFSTGPVFSRVATTFLGDEPEIGDYLIRINPIRSGPDSILRVIRSAFGREVGSSS
jgi:hypothetical protein